MSSGAAVNKGQRVEKTFTGEVNDRAQFATDRCEVSSGREQCRNWSELLCIMTIKVMGVIQSNSATIQNPAK